MPNDIPDTLAQIGDAVVALLAGRGPMSEEQILLALADAGADLGRDPQGTLDEVLDSELMPAVLPLADNRWVNLPSLLAGLVLTHRLSDAEVEHDFLAVTADLLPLSTLTEVDTYQHLVDGAPVTDLMPDFDADLMDERGIPADVVPELAMLLPRGRLATLGARPGDLVGLRVDPAGWDLERVDPGGVDETVAPRLGPLLGTALAAAPPGAPAQLDVTVWTACAQDPDLFRHPAEPLGDLLDVLGLATDGDLVAPAGFDFPGWRTTLRVAAVRRRHDLDEDEALVVLAVTGMYDQTAVRLAAAAGALGSGGDPEEVLTVARAGWSGPASHAQVDASTAEVADRAGRPTVRDLLPFLAEPAVADAVLAETLGTGREGAAALSLFAQSLEPEAPRAARVALKWLRAKALERLGRVSEAEEVLGAAQSLDPSWPPVLFDLAHYASDRGDLDRALDLLRRAGAPPDDFLVLALDGFRPPDRSGMARNQPCWCGSGRKYKQCHLHREQLPLDERAGWLYLKAGMYLSDGPWRDDVLDVAATLATYDDSPDALDNAVHNPLTGDAVLFEGGAFAAFLAERGVLLPDDERLLGEQWLLVERSVFEVEAVTAGQGITVRDLRTGDRLDVRERAASRQLTRGMLVCARFSPAGETTQAFGGIEVVALHQRDELMAVLDDEPDAVELAAFLARRFAPPQLQNTEGHPLVICEAHLQVPDPPALSAALDHSYQREDASGAGQLWHEYVTTVGVQRVRASLRLEQDRLTVETNSEARMDRVLASLRDQQPGLTVLDDTRRPAADLMEASARTGPLSPTGGPVGATTVDASDPQIAAILDQITRQHEIAWLDESIPALAGRTPREAAADPTRRPDLLRLLDSFAGDEDQPGLMSPRRLRADLDLDGPDLD